MLNELAREKLLIRYLSAVECGDFEAVAAVLKQAEQDEELAAMLLEIHDEWTDVVVPATEAQALIDRLLHKQATAKSASHTLPEMLPLTVADVATQMRADTVLRGTLRREVNQVVHRLQGVNATLPSNLSDHNITKLFTQLGVVVNRRVQSFFRETAVFLSMARQQDQAQWAATRRQQKQPNSDDAKEM